MMSAGLIGSTGLGYAKDRFTQEAFQEKAPGTFEQYKADKDSKFLVFREATGLDGKKLGEVQEKLAKAREELEKEGVKDPKAALDRLTPEERQVLESSIAGDRRTLVADSAIPATMAAIYLILLIYFKLIGGYKAVHIVPVAEPQGSTPANL